MTTRRHRGDLFTRLATQMHAMANHGAGRDMEIVAEARLAIEALLKDLTESSPEFPYLDAVAHQQYPENTEWGLSLITRMLLDESTLIGRILNHEPVSRAVIESVANFATEMRFEFRNKELEFLPGGASKNVKK